MPGGRITRNHPLPLFSCCDDAERRSFGGAATLRNRGGVKLCPKKTIRYVTTIRQPTECTREAFHEIAADVRTSSLFYDSGRQGTDDVGRFNLVRRRLQRLTHRGDWRTRPDADKMCCDLDGMRPNVCGRSGT